MKHIDDIISAQKNLLRSSGYTSQNLHVPSQPALFLSTLRTRLLDLDQRSPDSPISRVFTHRLSAEFENGQYPASLDFTYRYRGESKELTLLSLTASVFDVEITESVKEKRPVAELITAGALIKLLKERLQFYKSVSEVLKTTPAKPLKKRPLR
jgi:hypothetical protein